MKKRIILLGLCFLLLLIFTSTSYGGLDLKAKLIVKANPNQDPLLSPSSPSGFDDNFILIVPISLNVPVLVPQIISIEGVYPESETTLERELIFKTKAVERAR